MCENLETALCGKEPSLKNAQTAFNFHKMAFTSKLVYGKHSLQDHCGQTSLQLQNIRKQSLTYQQLPSKFKQNDEFNTNAKGTKIKFVPLNFSPI